MEDNLQEEFNQHAHTGIDSKRVRLADLAITKLPAITSPTSGGTVDAQARAAIDSIITTLENLGFIIEN